MPWRLIIQILLMLSPLVLPRMLRTAYLVWRLTFDSRVPLLLKLLVPAALVYFVVPVSIVPDVLPFGVGLIEDVLLLFLAVWVLIRFAPAHVVADYAPWRAPSKSSKGSPKGGSSKVVDSTYRIVDEGEGNLQPEQ